MQTNFYSFFQSQKACILYSETQALNFRQGKTSVTLVKKAPSLYYSPSYVTSQFRYFTEIDSIICSSTRMGFTSKNFLFTSFFSFLYPYSRSRISSISGSNSFSQISQLSSLDNFASIFSTTLAFSTVYANRFTSTSLLTFYSKYYFCFITKTKTTPTLFSSKQARFFYQQVLSYFEQSIAFENQGEGVVTFLDQRFFTSCGLTDSGRQIKAMSTRGLISTLFTRAFVRRFKVKFQKFGSMDRTFNSRKLFFKAYSSSCNKITKKVRRLPFFSRSIYPTQSFGMAAKLVKKTSKIQQKKVKITKVNSLTPVKTLDKQLQLKALSFKLYPSSVTESVTDIYPLAQLKAVLSLMTQSRITLYQVNALSLARFAFDREQERLNPKSRLGGKSDFNKKSNDSMIKLSQRFLLSLERERTSRFCYVAIFIKDLIRVSFFCRFLKKAAFLVSFFAFTLSKLPRNRKETNFLRFLMKLVKVFATQRKEILGVRLRFQGRVNR